MDVARWTGREAAALRQAHRMSIRAYAAHLGVSPASITNWEHRGIFARLRTDTQQLLDTDLARAAGDVQHRFWVILAGGSGISGAPDADFGSIGNEAAKSSTIAATSVRPPYDPTRAPRYPRMQEQGRAADDMAIVTLVIDGQSHQLRLSRRAVLGVASGGLLAPLLDEASGPADEHAVIDPAVVEHFAALRAVLVCSDNLVGPAAIFPTTLEQISHITRYRRSSRGNLRRALLRTEARWAEFAGWLSDDLGDHLAGDRWLGRALTMAQEVHDTEFTAYVFARMAQRAAAGADQDRVRGLAQAAARTGSARPRVRAFATLQKAHGHAIAGDTAGFESAINAAHHLVADSTPVDGELGSFCTTPYVWAQEGDGWLRLDQPRAALKSYTRALGMLPDGYRRDRRLYTARTAAAHAAAGDPERAATSAVAALTMADSTASARIRHEVSAVSRRLVRFRHQPAVAALFAALSPSRAMP